MVVARSLGSSGVCLHPQPGCGVAAPLAVWGWDRGSGVNRSKAAGPHMPWAPHASQRSGCSWLELVLVPPAPAALWVLGQGHLRTPQAGQGQEADRARRGFLHPLAGIFYPGSQAEISLQPGTKAASLFPSLSPHLPGGWGRLRRAWLRAAGGCPGHGQPVGLKVAMSCPLLQPRAHQPPPQPDTAPPNCGTGGSGVGPRWVPAPAGPPGYVWGKGCELTGRAGCRQPRRSGCPALLQQQQHQLISRAVGEQPAELRRIDGRIDRPGNTRPPSQRRGAEVGRQGAGQGVWQGA